MQDGPGRTEATKSHAVVIAGGGPAGLMLAAELALAGVDTVIVERRRTQDLESHRAGGLQARTLEVLDQRGVVERFLSQGRTAQTVAFPHIPLDISDFPTRHPYGLVLWQNRIEQILAAWVAELGVETLRGREVTSFAQDGGGVDVALSDGTSLRAAYLVGCDGGRSLVRKHAGIEFPGWDATSSWLIAEVEMAEEPTAGVRQDAKGVYAIGRMDTGLVRAVLREETIGRGEPSERELRNALLALYGTDFGLGRVAYLSRFSDACRQAASYRAGRVLLAGDAAHVHSPVGGQGLNTSVQDSVNLGWKLAQVVNGTSPDALLDTYHAERHPVAARVLRNNMAMAMLQRAEPRIDALRDVLANTLRMDGPRKLYGAILAGLDIHYDLGEGHALLGRRVPDLDVVVDGAARRVFSLLHEARPVLLALDGAGALDLAGWGDQVRCVDARCDAVWELPVLGVVDTPRALLLRPDGHVAWVGDGTDRGLGDALSRWFGPARAS